MIRDVWSVTVAEVTSFSGSWEGAGVNDSGLSVWASTGEQTAEGQDALFCQYWNNLLCRNATFLSSRRLMPTYFSEATINLMSLDSKKMVPVTRISWGSYLPVKLGEHYGKESLKSLPWMIKGAPTGICWIISSKEFIMHLLMDILKEIREVILFLMNYVCQSTFHTRMENLKLHPPCCTTISDYGTKPGNIPKLWRGLLVGCFRHWNSNFHTDKLSQWNMIKNPRIVCTHSGCIWDFHKRLSMTVWEGESGVVCLCLLWLITVFGSLEPAVLLPILRRWAFGMRKNFLISCRDPSSPFLPQVVQQWTFGDWAFLGQWHKIIMFAS